VNLSDTVTFAAQVYVNLTEPICAQECP